MIIDNLVSIFHNVLILFQQLAVTLHYLLDLNYQLVSFLLDLISKFIATFQLVLDGFAVAAEDFVLQYGDFCTILVNGVILVVHRTVDFVLYLVSLILSLFNYFLHGFLLLLHLPEIVFEKVSITFDRLNDIADDAVNFPVSVMQSILNGFSLILTTIFQSWVFILCKIFEIFLKGVNFFIDSTAFFITAIARGVFFLLMQPLNALKALFRGVYNVPLEALIGLVICVCIFYLIKFGIIRILIKMWFQLMRKIFVFCFTFCIQAAYKARYHLLPFAEMILLYTVPQLMIVFRLFRIAKRPIYIFISCVRVVYDYFFGVTTTGDTRRRRSASTENIRRTESIIGRPNPAENDERLMCIVCQDAEKTVMVNPCRHICLCRECADGVIVDQRRCPMCRTYITDTIDVYL